MIDLSPDKTNEELVTSLLSNPEVHELARRCYALLNSKHGDPTQIEHWGEWDENNRAEYEAEVCRVLVALTREGFTLRRERLPTRVGRRTHDA